MGGTDSDHSEHNNCALSKNDDKSGKKVEVTCKFDYM